MSNTLDISPDHGMVIVTNGNAGRDEDAIFTGLVDRDSINARDLHMHLLNEYWYGSTARRYHEPFEYNGNTFVWFVGSARDVRVEWEPVVSNRQKEYDISRGTEQTETRGEDITVDLADLGFDYYEDDEDDEE